MPDACNELQLDLNALATIAADAADRSPDRYVAVLVKSGNPYLRAFDGFAPLVEWYRRKRGDVAGYDYLAAFDKSATQYMSTRSPVASAPSPGTTDLNIQVSGDRSAELARLVALHETYFSQLAQRNPDSAIVRVYLQSGWDPFFGYYATLVTRGGLSGADVEDLSRRLSQLRANATALGIPVPNIGSSGPVVSGPHGGGHGHGGHGRGRRGRRYFGGYGGGYDGWPYPYYPYYEDGLPVVVVPADVPRTQVVSGPHGGGGHGGGFHGGGLHHAPAHWGHSWDRRGRRYFGGGGYDWGPYYYDPYEVVDVVDDGGDAPDCAAPSCAAPDDGNSVEEDDLDAGHAGSRGLSRDGTYHSLG